MASRRTAATTSALPAFLVIEDRKYSRRALCRLLRALGADRVAEATDVWSAKRVLGQRRDAEWVLLADPYALGETGLDMLKPLASEHASVRFLLLCAGRPPVLAALIEQARARGIAVLDVLQKPVSAEEMGTVLQHLLTTPASPSVPKTPAISLDELGECLRAGRLLTRFRPKLELASGRPIGCNAVAMLRHTRLGEVHASHYAQAIAQLGAQRVMSASILRDSANLVRALRSREFTGMIEIALSADVLSEPSDAGSLDAYVRTLGISPSDLAFEVAAEPAVWASPTFTDNLARLKVRGYTLVLGNAVAPGVLDNPASAHFSEIKIPCAELSRPNADPQRMEQIASVIGTARKHGIVACATDLKSLESIDLAREIGFVFGIGDTIAPAMLADETIAWIDREVRSPSFADHATRRHRAG